MEAEHVCLHKDDYTKKNTSREVHEFWHHGVIVISIHGYI